MEKRIHKQLINIPINQLHPHPENPRKNIGDVEELAKSIKANGLMQNLTVIPSDPEKPMNLAADFTVIIGHRRLAAAKLAGLTELPCKIIEGLSEREQLSTMLEENMQRTDLTIYEQAEGFQMMLDLGETMDTIKEKTGFSETTIRHRLNIAKLDRKKLKAAEDNFQISIKDLALLEGIKNIKTRNEVLSKCANHGDFAWRVSSAIKEEKRDEAEKAVLQLLKGMDFEKAPENFNRWSSEIITAKEFDLDGKIPKKSFKWDKEPPEGTKLICFRNYSSLFICYKGKAPIKEMTPAEKKMKEADRTRKKINVILKEFEKDRRTFVMDIISGKTEKADDSEQVIKECFEALLGLCSSISFHELAGYLASKNYWDIPQNEKEEMTKKAGELCLEHKLLMLLDGRIGHETYVVDFRGCYAGDSEDTSRNSVFYMRKLISILERYGFRIENPEVEAVLDGTSEIYIPQRGK